MKSRGSVGVFQRASSRFANRSSSGSCQFVPLCFQQRVFTTYYGVDYTKRYPYEKDIELYHNIPSSASTATRMCLSELGVEYKSHHIDLITTGQFGNLDPEYADMHPGLFVMQTDRQINAEFSHIFLFCLVLL